LAIDDRLLINTKIKRKLTKAEFAKKAQEIITLLDADYHPFGEDSPGEKEARKAKAFEDPLFFIKTYLPHYATCQFAPFHYDLVEMLEKRPVAGGVVRPVLCAAPRDFAKTTLTSFGYVLHQVVFKQRRFVLLISDTLDLAGDLASYIYLELAYNERLKHDFGRLVRENWDSEDFVTMHDVRLKARGRGQRLRGLKHRNFRPDLVILDDIENERGAKNPDIVRDTLRWVVRTVYPAIDPGGNLFWIGTLLTRSSALYTATHSKGDPFYRWERRVFRAIGEDGKSLWPDKFPLEVLHKQREQMGTAAFNQEKQNVPDSDDSLFASENIVYYQPEELFEKSLVIGSWFDPSIESGSVHDFKAIITVGYSPEEACYYVLDAYIKRATLDAALMANFTIAKLYQPLIMAVESNLFQRLLLREFDRMAKDLGQVLPLRGVINSLNKEVRVAGLSPLVERGKIKFRAGHSDQDLLVEQLTGFPDLPHDDGPDALEGAIRVVNSLTLKATCVSKVVDFHNYLENRGNMPKRKKQWGSLQGFGTPTEPSGKDLPGRAQG
jgi:predicted phage terminase large subunit-like protein